MNILVTGATGFVGQHLLPFLKKKNHQVYALVRANTDLSKVKTCEYFVFRDNIEELSVYLQKYQIDGVIHLASLYIPQHQSVQIKDLVSSNIYLGTAVLEAAVNAHVKWFLNTGTIWQNYCVPDKSDEYNPVNLYAATKQAFIDMAKFYTETRPIRFCTLKLCDTFGPDDTRPKIMALFKTIAENHSTLEMSKGEQKLDLLYIDDIVSGFLVLAEMLNDKNCVLRKEYVLSSGHQITLHDLSKSFESVSHKTLNIQWGKKPYRLREVMVPYIGHVLKGWKPEYTLKKGIEILFQSL